MSNSFDFDLHGKHLVIAIPAYDGNVPTDQMVSLINTMTLCRNHGVTITIEIRAGSALIEKARSELVHQFLSYSQGTHLLCIDSDVVWKPEDAVRLLAFCTIYDAVCGPYCTKEEEPDFHYGLVPNEKGRVIQNTHGLLKIKSAPMGFNCFRREVLERMVQAHPELNYVAMRGDFKDETLTGLFHTMIRPDKDGIPRMVGEDIAFYERMEALGIDAWVDPAIQLEHYGKKIYTMPYLDWVRKKNEEKAKEQDLESAA